MASAGFPRRGVPGQQNGNEAVVNQPPASSQSTAKTHDGALASRGSYGTMPRPSGTVETSETEVASQFYTLRPLAGGGPSCRPAFPTMGTRLSRTASRPEPLAREDDRTTSSEANRSLLYEQNMCAFEDFCVRGARGDQDQETTATAAAAGSTSSGESSLPNFCTLGRKGKHQQQRGGRRGEEQSSDYCTLKRKKFQLNRRFVESFLEDPNAKVVDYLSELDAYLDEMDVGDVEGEVEDEGESVAGGFPRVAEEEEEEEAITTAARGGGDASEEAAVLRKNADEEKVEQEGAVCQSQSLQYYRPARQDLATTGQQVPDREGEWQEDRIRFGDIKHFCTLPKQKRTQFLNAFKRGASLRRTFVDSGSRTGREVEEQEQVRQEGGQDDGPHLRANEMARLSESRDANGDANDKSTIAQYGQSGTDDQLQQQQQPPPRHHLPSWHRSSMRKQHLIELPEQQEEFPEDFPSACCLPPSGDVGVHRQSEPTVGNVESDEFSSISTLPVGELAPVASDGGSASTERLSATALIVALPPSPVPPPPPPENVVAPPAYSMAASAPLESNLDEDRVQSRPRQTGRRAQSQPRIGSITVERDETTNELIIRTNSVTEGTLLSHDETVAMSFIPRQQHQQLQQQHVAATATTPTPPPPQQQQQHHRRYTVPESEEGSSMGSSRNPSPVSLLSTTTTYSSMASAAENNAADDNDDHRNHRQSEQSRDGMEATGNIAPPVQEVATIATTTTTTNSRLASAGNGRRNASATEQQQRRSTGGTSTTANNRGQGRDTSVSVGPTIPPPVDEESEPETTRRSSRRNDGRPKARWPHAISRPLATTFCTLGLFNLSRFAVLSVHFGANFVVQFLLCSLFFGIPMLWLQMVLGARIRGGPVTMWRVSPICKGIGIALLLAQALITLYSAISLAWLLVYFRDAFITHNEKYRWQERFEAYRGGGSSNQSSYRLPDTVADYFNGVVLQRYHLIYQLIPAGGRAGGSSIPPRASERGSGIGAIRFQLAFNLAILWTLVFVALCRGIRSLGKVVVGLFLLALPALVAVCGKLLTFISYDSVQSIFPATDWQDFFLNPRCWTCAAQETFLTWGLLGVSIYALNCRSNRKGSCNSRTKRELRRDAFLVAFITIVVLLVAAVLGSACVQILNTRGYYYSPGSYENLGTNVFLRSSQPLPAQHSFMSPNRWFIRYSTVVGEAFKRSRDDPESGYQVLRLATELLPAALAVATPERIQPIWGLLAYLALLLFGLGQLCVMWKPIAGAIGDAPSSILLSCVTGLLLGMPLATEGGINIVHYLDTILGAAWWVLLLWIGHILALFLVRGRPFTSDILVNDLQVLQSFSAFVAFTWNILLPIGLIFMCIIQYRLSNSAALFNWPSTPGGSVGAAGASGYWPLWARQVGGFVQVSFLLLVPIVMVVQIYRYLCSGPPDILDRVDLLLRPPVDGETSNPIRSGHIRRPVSSTTTTTTTNALQQSSGARNSTPAGQHDGNTSEQTVSLSLDGSRGPRDTDDAPPKYTPPPSYTTATGARIAKMLRNSIRRSVRRIMGEPSGGAGFSRQRTALPQTACEHLGANPSAGGELPPPDYSSVLRQFGAAPAVEGVAALELGRVPSHRALYNSSTLGGSRRYRSLTAGPSSLEQQMQPLTASDVRQILRPATTTTSTDDRPSTVVAAAPSAPSQTGAPGFTQTLRNTLLLRRGHSMENLVLAAAPIGDSSIITLNCDDSDFEHPPDDNNGNAYHHRAELGRDSVI